MTRLEGFVLACTVALAACGGDSGGGGFDAPVQEPTINGMPASQFYAQFAFQRRDGMWKIEGARLVLGSFLECNGMAINNELGLRCTLASSIVTLAAQDHAGAFNNRTDPKTPDDSEFAEYVP